VRSVLKTSSNFSDREAPDLRIEPNEHAPDLVLLLHRDDVH